MLAHHIITKKRINPNGQGVRKGRVSDGNQGRVCRCERQGRRLDLASRRNNPRCTILHRETSEHRVFACSEAPLIRSVARHSAGIAADRRVVCHEGREGVTAHAAGDGPLGVPHYLGHEFRAIPRRGGILPVAIPQATRATHRPSPSLQYDGHRVPVNEPVRLQLLLPSWDCPLKVMVIVLPTSVPLNVRVALIPKDEVMVSVPLT